MDYDDDDAPFDLLNERADRLEEMKRLIDQQHADLNEYKQRLDVHRAELEDKGLLGIFDILSSMDKRTKAVQEQVSLMEVQLSTLVSNGQNVPDVAKDILDEMRDANEALVKSARLLDDVSQANDALNKSLAVIRAKIDRKTTPGVQGFLTGLIGGLAVAAIAYALSAR